MKHPEWTEADSHKCKQNITERIGQTAGIDPKSGQIWFGDSIQEIVQQRQVEGLTSPLFFERVGYEAYFWKGGRR